MERVRADALAMLLNATQVWGPVNLLLFAFVPLHMRTVVSMCIHYLFLVGLALWDAAKRKISGEEGVVDESESERESETCIVASSLPSSESLVVLP